MESGQYILPAELAVLIAFVLIPPALLAFALQAYYLRRRGLLSRMPGRAAVALISTLLIGACAAVALFLGAPASFAGALGIRDVRLFGQYWPAWPFGVVVLGLAALVTTYWFLRGGTRAA